MHMRVAPRRRFAAVAHNDDGCACSGQCSCASAAGRVAAATVPLDAPFPAPEYPPRQAFERPAWLERGQGLTIRDDGTWAGYFHDGEQGQYCIVGAPGCSPPVPSATGYAAFHQQQVTLDDGTEIDVGAIGMVGGHASPYASAGVASAHYANPDAQRLIGRAHDDFDEQGQWHGSYACGVVVPGLTYGDVAQARRSALSGDWRPFDARWFSAHGVEPRVAEAVEHFDCLGPTFVTRPGLPLVRAYRTPLGRAAAVLGGMGGIQLAPEETRPMQITLSDGTVVDLAPGETMTLSPDGSSLQLGGPQPLTAPAVIPAAAVTEAIDTPIPTELVAGPEPVTREEFGELRAMVGGLVDAQAARAAADAARLREAPVSLPA